MKEEMKKFHITVTNNETKDILFSKDTDAVLGSLLTEEGVDLYHHASCSFEDLLLLLYGCFRAIEVVKKDYPCLSDVDDLYSYLQSELNVLSEAPNNE